MGTVLYSAAMSLDGFIAGRADGDRGDMSWLTERLGPNPTVDDLIGRISALLVGNRTFRGEDRYKGVADREGKPFGRGWSGPQFVLTHHAPDTPVPGVTFVGDLTGGVAATKAAAGDKYVNILGADVARQCLAAGVRLFDHPGGGQHQTRTSQPDPGATRDERLAARRHMINDK